MDELKQAVEAVLEDELIRNCRIFDHPTYGRVIIKRPTPRQEKLIADERRRQYHKDLKDKDILSRSEILKLAKDREMWDEEDAAKEKELSQQIASLMGSLEALDYKDFDQVVDEYYETQTKLRSLNKENDEVLLAVGRYFDVDNDPLRGDRMLIFKEAPNSDVETLLERADLLRAQLDTLKQLFEIRRQHNKLQIVKTELLLDSLESRAERAERVAQIYYCCLKDDAPLWPTFDAAWDASPEDIELLIMELEYFNHGVTEEARAMLEKYGFLQRASVIASSSEDSPEAPTPSSDGESPESEQLISSESATSTN